MTIKKIEWKYNSLCSVWSEYLAFGVYYVLDTLNDGRTNVTFGISGRTEWGDDYLYTFPDLEQAKEGAQKHFETELRKYIDEST